MTSILPLIARRILVSVVILFIVSALLFCILRLLPVDPAAMSLPPNATLAEIEAKRHEMGLDQPLPRQYLIWLGQVVHGDFGTSIHFRRGVAGLIGSTLPATIELALLAMLVAGALGIAGGLFMFHVRGTAQGADRRHRLDRAAVAAGVPLGPVLHPAVRRGAGAAALHRPSLGRLPAPGRHRLPAARHLLVGRPDMFANAAQAHDPAVASRSASRSRRPSCACCVRA